jgi:hypothetical protein
MEIASVIKKGPTNDRILKTYNRFTVFDNLLYAKIALFHSLVRSRNVNMHIQLAADIKQRIMSVWLLQSNKIWIF